MMMGKMLQVVECFCIPLFLKFPVTSINREAMAFLRPSWATAIAVHQSSTSSKALPRYSIEVNKVKTISNHCPNADRVAAHEEEVARRFILASAKGARSTIRPTASR
jgi:hypothetical protein